MSNLKHNIIRLAYQNPDLRSDLLPLLSKVAGVPTYDEFLDNIKVDNPGTDSNEKVKIRTLKNSPLDSKAYKEYQRLKAQWDVAVKKEKGKNQEKENDEDGEDGEDDKSDEEKGKENKQAETVSKEFISENKGKLTKAVTKVKDVIKEKFVKFSSQEVSLGEITEMCMGLLVTMFKGDEGQKLITDLMETVDTRNEENFQKALAQLKSAEASAMLSEESKVLMDSMGLDPINADTNEEKIKEWLEDPDLDGEDIPDDVMDEILEFFFQITEGHMKFLRLFVDGNGDIDMDRLKSSLEKGIPDELKDKVDNQKKKSVQRVLVMGALQNKKIRQLVVPYLFLGE